MRMESCSSPRPSTFICSGVSVGSTRIETLPSSSRSRRSLICREVTYSTFPARHGGRIHAEDHRHRRLVDSNRVDCAPMLHVRNGFADRDVFDTGKADDVAGGRGGNVDPLQAFEGEELRYARVLKRSIQLADRDLISDPNLSIEDAADRDAAEVIARVKVGDEHLQRRGRIPFGRRHALDNGVEQRPEVHAGDVHRS